MMMIKYEKTLKFVAAKEFTYVYACVAAVVVLYMCYEKHSRSQEGKTMSAWIKSIFILKV